ncbi:hypothetical protein CL630_02460 [bacterium]|nr:hypothetical protein [bacterium]|tara:strand:+ start:41971 stop:44529 length:2559 start_codon:yes stop_codon:yes gene_type:complete
MQRIVITGGLGYIGTELCNLYSGETRFKKVVVIDNRFVSERVKQLRDWGIEFIHGDILDEKLIKEVLKDADIVHHLAGITNVAYTKTEADVEKDRLITKTAVEGSKNIINFTPKNCKIIFPSTHVIYEGFEDTKFNIKEDVTPTPVLTYSKGKVQTEKDLEKSDKNYVVLRLGSNYGYSQDTMRIKIMPNLFSKIASQNGTISLYSGGVQHKSLVSVRDVAQCFKFMAEKSDIQREIFHCTNENITVKDVAEICKKVNPKLTLIETEDEIPNLGYTLSNDKLLGAGFKFKYDIENSVKEMIDNWSEQDINTDLEYVVKGNKEYIDERGKISNYELTEPINLIGYIESKAGTVRANHYHSIQEQKCLLITGQYISVIKDLSVPDAPVETMVINVGDLSVVKPNVAHTMVFTEDSIFLNLVRGEREHKNYGVTHTKPYILVDEEAKDKLLNTYKTECRACDNKRLKRVLSLGNSPLANNLLDSNIKPAETYPLEMNYCPKCHNCQLSCVVPPQEMFDNYLYVSSTSESFRKHFEDAADKYIADFNLDKDSFVIDIGSNDGIALKPLKEKSIKVLGVEPAKNIAKIANENGINTINSYFNKDTVSKILESDGKADLVTASNVFAHADDLKGITNNAFNLLKDDGTFIIEVQYILDTINDLTFDNIYHEHVNYWSVTSLNNFFTSLGFAITDVEHIDTHGGSIRVYVQSRDGVAKPSVEEFLNREKEFGLLDFSTYQKFAKNVAGIKERFNINLKKLRDESNLVVGYGSPAKATTALNYFDVSNKDIDYIIEDNKLKHGKYLPGVNIPIKSKNDIGEIVPDTVLVLAWNFTKEIANNNQDLIEKGARFISVKDLER